MTPYRTAAGYGEAEYEDKRSRFIGHIKPVTSENEARAFIDEMRRTYADATHNVFAYVLREGNILRWSDDGEPGGTSGQPTLAVLQGRGADGRLLRHDALFRRNAAWLRRARARLLRRGPRRCARQAPPSCAHGGAGALPAPTPGTNGCAAFWKSAARALRKRSSARRSRSFFRARRRRAGFVTLLRDATAGEAEVRLGESVFRPEREEE